MHTSYFSYSAEQQISSLCPHSKPVISETYSVSKMSSTNTAVPNPKVQGVLNVTTMCKTFMGTLLNYGAEIQESSTR